MTFENQNPKHNYDNVLKEIKPSALFVSGHNHSLDVGIATKLGLSAGIIYNHFFYWIKHNKVQGVNFKEGKTWTYQTIEDMGKYIPYLSVKQIRTGLEALIEAGLILKGKFNKTKMDHTIWYALSEEPEVEYSQPTRNERFALQGKSNCPPGQKEVPSRANLSYSNNTVNILEKERQDQEPTSDNCYKDSLNLSLSSPSSKTKIEKPILEPFGSHVKLTKEQYQEFCKIKSKAQIDELIEEINDYCAASRPKGYLDYAAALRQWLKRKARDVLSAPLNNKLPSMTDRRTKNIDGSSMPSPADGRF